MPLVSQQTQAGGFTSFAECAPLFALHAPPAA